MPSSKPVLICFLLQLGFISFSAADDLPKAEKLRLSGQYGKAERVLKKYSTPQKVYDSLKPSEKINYLRGVLELAHVRALKEDVNGALLLLNWAEGRKEPYQRALACVKYGRILADLREMERASAYLKNADEVIRQHINPEEAGAAIGQGGETADTGAVWRDLQDDAEVLKAEIESERLKKKFGASYANYVKLRRLEVLLKRARTPRYMKEANALADELMKTDPASPFAAAAGYLKGSIAASCLKEQSPKKEIKAVKDYLNEFVHRQPDGLYRGEALMLLGKISLEIEWNAKEAGKYYSQALNWFRKARERRDALSLYAGMNDELKKRVQPTRKPTTLNQWKRIVYHDEDPLKLYNIASAPAWYMDDKEKNILLLSGLLYFANGQYDVAEKSWKDACNSDENIRYLESNGLPSLWKRLQISCRQKFLVTDSMEHRGVSSAERLKILLAEMYFLSEQTDLSRSLWKNIVSDARSSAAARAIAILGEADCVRMDVEVPRYAESCYERVLRDVKLSKTPVAARAYYNWAWRTLQKGVKFRLAANQLFEDCASRYPESKYAEASLFYLALINAGYDRKLSDGYAQDYFSRYPRGAYADHLRLRLQEIHKKTITNTEKRKTK